MNKGYSILASYARAPNKYAEILKIILTHTMTNKNSCYPENSRAIIIKLLKQHFLTNSG